MLKSIIFDVDGVLLETNAVAVECKLEVLKEYGLDLKDYEPVFSGISLKFLVEQINKDFNKNIDVDEFIDKRESMYEKRIGESIKVFDGVREFLSEVKSQGFSIGLGTSATRRRFNVNIKASKLDFEFDTIVTADDVENHKPAPDVYLKAASNLGVLPENCIVIEDNPLGVEAAKKAGMKCIGITNSFSRDKLGDADFIVERIGESAEFIKTIIAESL
jgi:HAD superfamily hydrolase (TIGR01509 family)